MDFELISHFSIIHEICTSESALRQLQSALKNNLTYDLKESLTSIGHNSNRSIMWILEECILKCDFATGKVIDKPEGYNFSDLYFNMLTSFDGFKGVEVEQSWLPPIDMCSRWSKFSFDSSICMTYFEDMKRRLSGRKTAVSLFIASVGLAILHKNNQIIVHRSNFMSILCAITNQFGMGLLKAFVHVFPIVQKDLDKNAIHCDEFVRKRKIEQIKLPQISTLLPKRKDLTLPIRNAPVVENTLIVPPFVPTLYLPETVHPSWFSALPLTTALIPPTLPSPTTPQYTILAPTLPSPQNLPTPLWNSIPFQPSIHPHPAVIVGPTRELPYIPFMAAFHRSHFKKRVYLTKTERNQIVALMRPEDYTLPRKVAAKRIMERQIAETGKCHKESQIICLLNRLIRDRKTIQQAEREHDDSD